MRAVTLVLLPGLDGTEVFYRPLLASLPGQIRPMVVSYPDCGANDYADLLPVVQRAVAGLPEFYVLGWSFSGPLALMLAAAEPKRVRGVILSASFVCAPRPLLARMRFAAVGPVVWALRAVRRLPIWILRRPDDPFRRAKAETWARVGAGVLAARVRAVLGVDVREVLRRCGQPLLCIVPSEDRAVPPHNLEEIARQRPTAEIVTIAGPHLAMYTNPGAAADAIERFIMR
jgi:pimeloyl-ACP methyl ester carboxylesterase